MCRREVRHSGFGPYGAPAADASGTGREAHARLYTSRHHRPLCSLGGCHRQGHCVRCQRRHRSVEFRRFLDAVDVSVPAELDVHLILDNSAIHKTALIQRWLAQRPRYHVDFTPTGSSRLNLVEIGFGLLTEKQLRRGFTAARGSLKRPLPCTLSQRTPIRGLSCGPRQRTIFRKSASLCMRTSNSEH